MTAPGNGDAAAPVSGTDDHHMWIPLSIGTLWSLFIPHAESFLSYDTQSQIDVTLGWCSYCLSGLCTAQLHVSVQSSSGSLEMQLDSVRSISLQLLPLYQENYNKIHHEINAALELHAGWGNIHSHSDQTEPFTFQNSFRILWYFFSGRSQEAKKKQASNHRMATQYERIWHQSN